MKFNFESFLKEEEQKDYFISIFDYLEKHPTYFPSKENIFNAFKNFDYDNLKIVIIGQDPYATKEYADGLCFSTKSLVRPKSLTNIFNEINYSYPNVTFESNNLLSWKNQGILLINSILTVNENEPLSHNKIGWQTFTLNLLQKLNLLYSNIIYLILGNESFKFIKNIKLERQIIYCLSHPSPLSYKKSFYHSNIFKKINEKLLSLNKKPIDWSTY